MTATWPAWVRRAGDAAVMALQAVNLVGGNALQGAVGLTYGPVVDSPAGQDLVEAIAVLAAAIGRIAELEGVSASQVVDELVSAAETEA